jgi:hypothetical protein
MRRGGREAEGGGLLNRYTGLHLYREFESHLLRQFAVHGSPGKSKKSKKTNEFKRIGVQSRPATSTDI